MSRAKREDAPSGPTIFLLVGAGIISAWQVGKMPVALASLQSDLALDLAAASWLLSAFAFVGAIVGAPIGVAVDRFGAKRMTIAGLLVQGIASAVGAMATDEILLGMTRVVEGVGFLAVIIAAPALIVSVASPADRERAMALWATFMPAGMSSIMLAGAALEHVSWRGFWMFIGVTHLAYVATLVPVLRRHAVTPGDRRDIRQDITLAIRSRGPWLLGGLFAAQATAFFAVFGFLPSILSERLAIEGAAAAVLSAIAVAASAVGNLVTGQLLGRGIAPSRLLLISFATLACSAFGIFSGNLSGMMAYILCIVFSIAGGVIPVVIFNAAPSSAPRPELVGLTVGFAMQGNNVGLALGPAATGALVSAFGWSAIPYLILTAAICASVLTFAHSRLKSA
ncbi:MAG TPA: MFS transporter [Steroidobacter sp.]|uniref:MFS transporter n=1 Tax=Steroidobacter sp. TaxID=1978227 RepID=UPI002EDB9C77